MIKTLAKCIGKYKKESIITPIFTAVEVFLEILIPFITASIIDKGIQAGDMRKVGIYGGIMLIIAFLSLFCGIQAGKYGAAASTGFACNLREKMYENIQTFSFSNIDKFSTAGLVTRMTTDVTNVQNAYQMIIRSVVRAPLMMICSITMCVIISPRLSIIFLVALIFLGFVLFFIIYKVTPVFTSGFENMMNSMRAFRRIFQESVLLRHLYVRSMKIKSLIKRQIIFIKHLLKPSHFLHLTIRL